MLIGLDDDKVDGEDDCKDDYGESCGREEPEPGTFVEGATGVVVLGVVVRLLVCGSEERRRVAGSGGEGAVWEEASGGREVLRAARGVVGGRVDQALARIVGWAESGHGGGWKGRSGSR